MTTNIGSLDRLLRLILGLTLLGLGYYHQTWWGLVGLVPLLTAAVRSCPLYTMIGLRTCARKQHGP